MWNSQGSIGQGHETHTVICTNLLLSLSWVSAVFRVFCTDHAGLAPHSVTQAG